MSSILNSSASYSDLQKILKQYWGFEDFRNFQQPIVESVLRRKDTLGILPTGGGKSICYQAPAILFPGITIVVSPLIALMNDQVKTLLEKGIEAIALHSGKSLEELMEAELKLIQGRVQLVYVSPEKLISKKFRRLVANINVSLIAVDEAHCISQWGHDFRPSYREISSFQSAFRQIPMIAVTATATPKVQADIVKNLEMREPDCWVNSTNRTELEYAVVKTENKFGELVNAIEATSKGSIIVYARNRRTIAELSHQLFLRNITALGYHAGMSNIQKLENQTKWISNEVQVMVATNAFGMGIDKPDVRKVIHYEPPMSLEEYVQEAGRAGRDRKQATAVILLGDYDMQKKAIDLEKAHPSIDHLLKIFNYLKVEHPDGHSSNFSIQQFAEAIKISILKTYYALQILDKWNIISLGRKLKEPSLVKVFMDKEKILFSLSESTQNLFKLLIKMYDGILYKKVKINENYISAELRCSISNLHKELVLLQNVGLIEYVESIGSLELRINICESEEVKNKLSNSNYLDLKDVAIEKLGKMGEYLNSVSCRQYFIEYYFGGKGDEIGCDNCDVCLSKRPKNTVVEKESVLYSLLEGKINTVQELLLQYQTLDKQLIVKFIEEWERQGIIELKGNVFNRL